MSWSPFFRFFPNSDKGFRSELWRCINGFHGSCASYILVTTLTRNSQRDAKHIYQQLEEREIKLKTVLVNRAYTSDPDQGGPLRPFLPLKESERDAVSEKERLLITKLKTIRRSLYSEQVETFKTLRVLQRSLSVDFFIGPDLLYEPRNIDELQKFAAELLCHPG